MERGSKMDEVAREATHGNFGCAYLRQDLECPWGCQPPTRPEMALRPYADDPDRLDDVVVKDVAMFRAEMMSNGEMWLACYFDNKAAIQFRVTAGKRGTAQLHLSATTVPDYIDLDAGAAS